MSVGDPPFGDQHGPVFGDHPKTLGEVRAERAGDASKWAPRDALLQMLREIDNGANIDAMVICYRIYENGAARGRYVQATPDGLVTLGLLSATAHNIMVPG